MSDYLTDEEQLDRLKKWWEQNGLMLAGAVALAVVGVVGWNWYGESRSAEVAAASDLYVAYLEATGTEQETIAETLAAEHSGTTYHALVLLRDAQRKSAEEDFEGALEPLEAALAVVREDSLADIIRLRMARLEQQLDRSEAALARLADVRSAGLRSQVQELKGDIHMARGERRLAHESYAAALEAAPEDAQPQLLELKVADTADANDA
ncbi:MAG: tetratricopeptide repeat protein [Pseudomonadota bacterium]